MKRSLLLGLLVAGAPTLPACAGRAAFVEPIVAPANVLQVRWRRKMTEEPLIEYKPQEFAAGSSDGRRVFVGSSSGDFYALTTREGDILWRRPLGAAVAGTPLVVPSLQSVFIGTEGGFLVALDSSTGRERWRYKLQGPIQSQPAYSDGILYFTSGENRVYAVDARTGTWRWQYDREAPESFTVRGTGSPLVYNGRVYVGFSDGYLGCVNASTGEVAWARSLAGDATRFIDVDATPIVVGGTLYVSSYSGGVYALEPKDGSTRWRFDVEGAGSVRVSNGMVFFSAAGKGLHALDLEGRLVWRQALAKGGELSAPLLIGRWLIVSASEQGVYVAEAATGRLAQFFFTGHGATGTPTTDGKQVYVLSNGGYFYALSLPG